MSRPRISFVTAVYDCLPLTQAMLRSLEATVDLTEHELILVDDHSTDGTDAFFDTLAGHANTTVLRNPANLGFAKSNNRAARASRGEILLFLNNDLELTPGWLEPMVDFLQTLPSAGAVGNVQRNYDSGLVDHAGIFFDLDGMPTHAHKNRRNPPKGDWIERNAVTAACLAVRRDTFFEMGGFDEEYLNGFEDVALCMKLRQAGSRIYVALQSVVNHHISRAPGRNVNNERNTERFRQQWSDFARSFGVKEWPVEYFRRYARFWWRINPSLATKALLLLLKR